MVLHHKYELCYRLKYRTWHIKYDFSFCQFYYHFITRPFSFKPLPALDGGSEPIRVRRR